MLRCGKLILVPRGGFLGSRASQPPRSLPLLLISREGSMCEEKHAEVPNTVKF